MRNKDIVTPLTTNESSCREPIKGNHFRQASNHFVEIIIFPPCRHHCQGHHHRPNKICEESGQNWARRAIVFNISRDEGRAWQLRVIEGSIWSWIEQSWQLYQQQQQKWFKWRPGRGRVSLQKERILWWIPSSLPSQVIIDLFFD